MKNLKEEVDNLIDKIQSVTEFQETFQYFKNLGIEKFFNTKEIEQNISIQDKMDEISEMENLDKSEKMSLRTTMITIARALSDRPEFKGFGYNDLPLNIFKKTLFDLSESKLARVRNVSKEGVRKLKKFLE